MNTYDNQRHGVREIRSSEMLRAGRQRVDGSETGSAPSRSACPHRGTTDDRHERVKNRTLDRPSEPGPVELCLRGLV